MTPNEQEKTLVELGFRKAQMKYVYYWVKGYNNEFGNGTLYINDNNTFNISCHSSVYDLIVADLTVLREKKIV